MDTSSLQTFISIAENASFSRASEQLYLTQPAVSKRLSALELELGTRLFDRIGRKVLLTEAGHLFLKRAKRILQELGDSITEIDNLSETVSGQLRLGTSHHIGLHRMPPVLKAFSQGYPQVDMNLQFMNSEAACAAVLDGNLELAVVTLPQQALPQLRSIIIWPDPLVLVFAHNHPIFEELSRQTNPAIVAKKISQLAAILPQSDTFTRHIINQQFQRYDVDIKIGLSTNYLETIKMLVRIGMGWSVLPCSMLDDSLQVVDCPDLQMSRQLGVVWHAQRTRSNAAMKMLELIQQYGTNPSSK